MKVTGIRVWPRTRGVVGSRQAPGRTGSLETQTEETAGPAPLLEVTEATLTPVQLKSVEQAFRSLTQTTAEQRQAHSDTHPGARLPTSRLRDPGSVT